MKASQLLSRTLLWVLTTCAVVSIGTKAFYSTQATFSWASPGFYEEYHPTEGKILVAKVIPKTPKPQNPKTPEQIQKAINLKINRKIQINIIHIKGFNFMQFEQPKKSEPKKPFSMKNLRY
ncbi:MAG TPA: hypothetical protein PKZ20_20205 [Rhodocyclaceae bacterium]|nr:hypothetical protein [Rhodocyclaceae bacterium]